MTNKNFYEELTKYKIDTKGLDVAVLLSHLEPKTKTRFAKDSETMGIYSCRCFIQAAYNLCNQMLGVGSNQLISHEAIIEETHQLMDAGELK